MSLDGGGWLGLRRAIAKTERHGWVWMELEPGEVYYAGPGCAGTRIPPLVCGGCPVRITVPLLALVAHGGTNSMRVIMLEID